MKGFRSLDERSKLTFFSMRSLTLRVCPEIIILIIYCDNSTLD